MINPRFLNVHYQYFATYRIIYLHGVKEQVNPVVVLKNAYYANLHLSRDSRMLAFVTRSNNVTELWTVSTSGGVPKKIMSDNDPKILISSLAWTPDGRSIIFGKQTRTNVLSILTN